MERANSANKKGPEPALSSAASVPYVLNRDYLASSRLNLQYFLWKNTLGFILHPAIPQPKVDARIADVATGTGVWLIELASSLPSTTQLDGFDISLSQAPAPGWLPKNVSMREWDMFEDPPQELIGQYDIVHIRLVTLLMTDNNAVSVIRNLHQLLKPGGYLQWSEIDIEARYIDKPDPSISTVAFETLFIHRSNPEYDRPRDGWQDGLAATMSQNAFEGVETHTYKQNPHMARYWQDMYMQGWEEWAAKVHGNTERTRSMLQQVVKESQSGAVMAFPLRMWTARAIAASPLIG